MRRIYTLVLLVSFAGGNCFAGQTSVKNSAGANAPGTAATVGGNNATNTVDSVNNSTAPTIAGQNGQSNTITAVSSGTDVQTVDVSTSTLDFSDVPVNKRNSISQYIKSWLDYHGGKISQRQLADTAIKLRPDYKLQLSAMSILAKCISDDNYRTSIEKVSSPIAVLRMTLSGMAYTWTEVCKRELGEQKCLDERLLPAIKYTTDAKVKLKLIDNMYAVVSSIYHKPEASKSIDSVSDELITIYHSASNPDYLTQYSALYWSGLEKRDSVMFREFEFFKTNPDLFSYMGGHFNNYADRNPYIFDTMYEIIENPEKYPRGIFEGAMSFISVDVSGFMGDKNGERRKRTKRDLQKLKDNPKLGDMAKHASGLLYVIADKEKRGVYK
jgi:hypothetical protein